MAYKIISILAVTAPVCALILGLICWRFPPKGPTWELGFRSRRARAGEQSWAFAQQLAGKLWFFLGLVLLTASIALIVRGRQIPAQQAMQSFLRLLTVQILCFVLVTVGVNITLLCRFDRFGRDRKEHPRRQPEPREPEEEEEQAPELSEEMGDPTWDAPVPEQWETDMDLLDADDPSYLPYDEEAEPEPEYEPSDYRP